MRQHAPGTLLAKKVDPDTGETLLTRPLCTWPSYARYRGRGDPDKAINFRCVTP